MLTSKFIGLDALGAFRDKVLAGFIQGEDSATVVPEGTIAKSYVLYYSLANGVYSPANPQPTPGSSIPANTYYIIGEGSPSDVTRAASVRAVVNYINNLVENDLGPDINGKVSSVSYNTSTKKLSYMAGGRPYDVMTFGSNAFTDTTIPTTYIKEASVSGKTLTLTEEDGTTTVTFAPDTTYTFAEGSTSGAFSVTPSGGSAQSVPIHGLGTAAYVDSEAFLSATGTAVSAATANSVPLNGVSEADDLKAIEALEGTSGFLKKTGVNTWSLDTNTYNYYEHPTTTANTASAVKVGNDTLGHVVLGAAITPTDIGAADALHNHDGIYLTVGGKAASATVADSVPLSGVTNASDLQAIEVLEGTSGFLKKTGANTWTLDTSTYNNYTHPTTDGNKHVPATGDSSNGKVLVAGSSAGSFGWKTLAEAGISDTSHNHDSDYLSISGKAASATVADAVNLSGVNNADDLKAIEALSGTNGFLKKTAANTWELDTNTYNNYVHPTTDGNHHVPATGTENSGKVLVAGEGTESWKTLSEAGIATSDHQHAYAGSESYGGPANSALRLTTNAGSGTQPIYFSGGVPTATTYSLNKTVPADALFTDTIYTHPTTDGNKHVPATSDDSDGKVLVAGDSAGSFGWKTLAEAGISDTSHTHSYAGSDSVGGAATSANKLNTSAGSATQPIYFSGGIPTATTYALNKTVPADAVFTDTVYTHPTTTAQTAAPVKVGNDEYGHVVLGATITPADIGASASGHTHLYAASESAGGPANSALTATNATTANKVQNSLTINLKAGASDTANTEGTDKYTFNGLNAKTLTITAGSNVTFTKGEGTLSISSVDSYEHPSYDVATASAKKIGRDATGHVVIGSAITPSDIGAAASGAENKTGSGAQQTATKLFLVGATSQTTSSTTYSNSKCYIDANGKLYSNNDEVLVKTSPALTGTPTAPTASVGTNTTQIATTEFVKTEIDSVLQASDAMRFKGVVDGTHALPSTGYSQGDTYKVGSAGTYAGKTCEIGDMIICLADYAQATASDNDWTVVQNNIDGAVTGPASATNGNFALFDGTSGKVIKNSSYSPSSFALASHGNHVPTVQTADNATYLRNDNTWHQITPANIGASASGHTHTWASVTDKTYETLTFTFSDNTTSSITVATV